MMMEKPRKQNTGGLDIKAGWMTLEDTPEIMTVGGDVHSFKKGELLPSWLYASFPREIRQKYFKQNDILLSELYKRRGEREA